MHNAPIFYIQVPGEGGTHPALPDTRPEFAPLMVNQSASAATLIDAAHARVERIGLIAKPFTFIGAGLSHIPPESVAGVLQAIYEATQEIMPLLQASQYAKPETSDE